MKFAMRPLSLDDSNRQCVAARSTSSGKIMKWESNTKYFFHILPPWEGVNVIGREAWDCYGLPNIPGQKFFAHTLWKSFEEEEPGIGLQDPVLAVLEKYKKFKPLEKRIEGMIPFSPKFFMNGLLVATIKVTDTKQDVEDSYVKFPIPRVETFKLSGKHFETIMGWVVRAEKSEAGSLLHPLCSGMIGVTKTGDGKESRYHVEIMGSLQPEGLVPTRYNLVDTYGEDKVNAWFNNIPNLSKRCPCPGEAARVECNLRAQALNAVLLADLKKLTPAERGPQGTATNAQPKKEEATLPDPKLPTEGPTYTPRMIKEKDLGLETAPAKDDGTPICLGRHSFLQATPNKAWCGSCSFINMCRIQGTSA